MTELVQSHRRFFTKATIGTLLAQLGLAYPTANFWTDNSFILDEILHDAFEAYRRLIVQLQPRTLHDDRESATQLNALWSEIKRRFHQHMHPSLSPSRGGRDKGHARPRVNGVYDRRCPYRKCRKAFKTTNRRKLFCCRRHGIYERGLRSRSIKRSYRNVIRRCKYPACMVRFKPRRMNQFYHTARCQMYAATRRWTSGRRWNGKHWVYPSPGDLGIAAIKQPAGTPIENLKT